MSKKKDITLIKKENDTFELTVTNAPTSAENYFKGITVTDYTEEDLVNLQDVVVYMLSKITLKKHKLL